MLISGLLAGEDVLSAVLLMHFFSSWQTLGSADVVVSQGFA